MKDYIRLRAIREAGNVERCHVIRHLGSYTIAQHSYGVVNLLLMLHPNPSMNLLKAALWHDVAERWLGDLPATAKWDNPTLMEKYEKAEQEVLHRLRLTVPLDEDERKWLSVCDLLDLWLWTKENDSSPHVRQIQRTCQRILTQKKLSDLIPEEAWRFFRWGDTSGRKMQLSDRFDDITVDLLESEE